VSVTDLHYSNVLGGQGHVIVSGQLRNSFPFGFLLFFVLMAVYVVDCGFQAYRFPDDFYHILADICQFVFLTDSQQGR